MLGLDDVTVTDASLPRDQEPVATEYVTRHRMDANNAISGLESATTTILGLPTLIERLRATNNAEALNKVETILQGLGNLSTALDSSLGE